MVNVEYDLDTNTVVTKVETRVLHTAVLESATTADTSNLPAVSSSSSGPCVEVEPGVCGQIHTVTLDASSCSFQGGHLDLELTLRCADGNPNLESCGFSSSSDLVILPGMSVSFDTCPKQGGLSVDVSASSVQLYRNQDRTNPLVNGFVALNRKIYGRVTVVPGEGTFVSATLEEIQVIQESVPTNINLGNQLGNTDVIPSPLAPATEAPSPTNVVIDFVLRVSDALFSRGETYFVIARISVIFEESGTFKKRVISKRVAFTRNTHRQITNLDSPKLHFEALSNNSNNVDSTGLIVGVTIAGVVALALIALIAIVIIRKRSAKRVMEEKEMRQTMFTSDADKIDLLM